MYEYDVINRKLINKEKECSLTLKEHKLLIYLMEKRVVSMEDLAMNIYGSDDEYIRASMRILKYRLCKKTGLKIKGIEGKYILIDEVKEI